MGTTRKNISDKFYRQLDIRTDGKLSDACTEEEFYEEFEEAFYDYMILAATIIE